MQIRHTGNFWLLIQES